MTPGRIRDALRLLALDGAGLGGLWLRARPGPVRDAVLAALEPLGARRIGPQTPEDALSGGIDLAATLSAGQVVSRPGILEQGGLVIVTGAERLDPARAARLAQAVDDGGLVLVCLDEGAAEDEGLPAALADRLGLFLYLDDMRHDALDDLDTVSAGGAAMHEPDVTLAPDQVRALIETAAALAIDGMRAPLLAARTARGLAALDGAATVTEDHLARAVALCLAHRGTPLPQTDDTDETAEDDTPPPEERDSAAEDDSTDAPSDSLPAELLVAAARAQLPTDLLRSLAEGRRARAAKGSGGTGAAQRGHRRGRPLPARPGRPGDAARLDLVATLRAAAPWQTIRARTAQVPRLVHLRPADFRTQRFEERTERLLIFCVDASGSQAVARLAEAKGAIELLLAQAYARRDHVALVAFRGKAAEVLLPPTRSLVQTKKRLAALPGGGGTPLAAGVSTACDLAQMAARRGLTPSLALLTDGRANIDLDGQPDRQRAQDDALSAAARAGRGLPGGIVIDTGRRPSPTLATLAKRAAASYVPLPRADAASLSRTVAPLLDG